MAFHNRRNSIPPECRGDLEAIRTAAIVQLARRDFSSVELRKRLTAQGYAADAAATAIAELIESRIVDDARFAANFVAYRANRGQGPVRIAADLKALGLPPALIDAALAAGAEWHTRAQAVRARRFGSGIPKSWREKSRQARFLQYRGFSSDHIRAALGTDFNLDD
jgi:regulatory protein